MEVITIDPGHKVYCDYCSKDFTDLPDSGGILFGSYAVCPDCAPETLKKSVEFGEQEFVRSRCPEGKSFADWVRDDLR